MRKFFLSGVAALGFLAVGAIVTTHARPVRLADAGASAPDTRANTRDLVAMIEASRSGRPMLVADTRSYGIETHKAHNIQIATA